MKVAGYFNVNDLPIFLRGSKRQTNFFAYTGFIIHYSILTYPLPKGPTNCIPLHPNYPAAPVFQSSHPDTTLLHRRLK